MPLVKCAFCRMVERGFACSQLALMMDAARYGIIVAVLSMPQETQQPIEVAHVCDLIWRLNAVDIYV